MTGKFGIRGWPTILGCNNGICVKHTDNHNRTVENLTEFIQSDLTAKKKMYRSQIPHLVDDEKLIDQFKEHYERLFNFFSHVPSARHICLLDSKDGAIIGDYTYKRRV